MNRMTWQEEARELFIPGSRGIINAMSLDLCPLVKGNPARAPGRFKGLTTNKRWARQSLMEDENSRHPRLTTRKSGNLFDPVSDEKLLTKALELNNFHQAVQEDERFKDFFRSTTPWPERARKFHVISYTEKVYACQVASKNSIKFEWNPSYPRIGVIRNIGLQGSVALRTVHGENVTLTCSLPYGDFVQDYGMVIEVSDETETLTMSASNSDGWDPRLKDRKVNVTFAPRPSRHRLLATAAIEGVTVFMDSVTSVSLSELQDRAMYTVDHNTIRSLRNGNDKDSWQCTQEQRDAAVLMLHRRPARTMSIVAGPRYSGKTRSGWLAARTFLRCNNGSKQILYFYVVADNQAALQLINWLQEDQESDRSVSNFLFLQSDNAARSLTRLSPQIQRVCWPVKEVARARHVSLYIGTCESYLRLCMNNSRTRQPPDVVIFDGVLSVNPLQLISAAFAQGQPARVIFLVDTETPSPETFMNAEEARNTPFGLRELLEGREELFPNGVLNGVHPEFGINLTSKFGISINHKQMNHDLYHPRLKVETGTSQADCDAAHNCELAESIIATAFHCGVPHFAAVITTNCHEATEVQDIENKTFTNPVEADVVVSMILRLIETHGGNSVGQGKVLVAATALCRGQVFLLRDKMKCSMVGRSHHVPILHLTELINLDTQILVVSLVRSGMKGSQDFTVASDRHIRALLLSVPNAAIFLVGDVGNFTDVWQMERHLGSEITARALLSKHISDQLQEKETKSEGAQKEEEAATVHGQVVCAIAQEQYEEDNANMGEEPYGRPFALVYYDGFPFMVTPYFKIARTQYAA